MVEGASPKARVSGGRRPPSNLDGRIVNGAPSVTRGKRSRERGVSVTGTGRTGTSYADPADDPSKKWARGCAAPGEASGWDGSISTPLSALIGPGRGGER